MYEVYLAHHGILGQKWGVRRYQNPDGSLTAEGRKRYAIDSDGKIRKLSSSERRAAVKMEKNRAAALEKARKARVEKAEYNKQKAEAIKSGDASKIEKYFKDLTPAEMQDAVNRINTKQTFQRLLNQEAQLVSNGKSKTDKLMERVGKVTDYAETGIKFYNVFAKVNNALSDNFMPLIGSGESRSEHERKLRKEEEDDKRQRKEAKEKKKAEKEEKERSDWVRKASLQEILDNPDKIKLNEWENINKRSNAQSAIIKYYKDRKGEAEAAEAARTKKREEDRAAAEAKAKSQRESNEAMRALNKETRERIVNNLLFADEDKRRAAERIAKKNAKKSYGSVLSDYNYAMYGF